ncbi:hypothetical protein AK830_g7553 [Neonectria ditissima]|uniref:Uncharacterized protein n=1 Tax=Neonectria ditissima TaxID=78410 RepID=A0A0P7BDK5_9HYPO|nr:hypothetical protein AK830_g7553 [Neonectria ditissima]
MAEILRKEYKIALQAIQLILVVTVLALSVVRMITRPAAAPRSQANTMSLGMAAKSLVILLYEITTDHVRSLKRWRSLKAYTILNAVEIVFWGAVVYLTIQANGKFCEGTSCTLSWTIVGMAVTLSVLAFCMATVCFVNFRILREEQEHQAAMKAKAKQASLEPSQETEQCFERDGMHGSQGRHGRETVPPITSRRSGHGLNSVQGRLSPSDKALRYGQMYSNRGRFSVQDMYPSRGNNSQHGLPLTQSRHSLPSEQICYGMDQAQGMQNMYAQPNHWEMQGHQRSSTQGYPVAGGYPTYSPYPYQFVQYGGQQGR